LRVLIDTVPRFSGGYFTYLKGILASGSIPADVSVVLSCTSPMAKNLGELSSQVQLAIDDQMYPSFLYMRHWRRSVLPELIARYEADVLFSPAGRLDGSPKNQVPRVTMCRNLLPFEGRESKRYGWSAERLRLEVLRMVQNESFRSADGVIFLTRYAHQVVSCSTEIRRFAIIPHGVGAEFVSFPQTSPFHTDQHVRLLYVSPISLYKHPWHVLSAIEKVRNSTRREIQIDFVGGGEPKAMARLQREIEARGRPYYVRVVPEIPYGKMPCLYREADIFIFASSCENFPNILLEAMASGLPIACSDISACSDLLKDGGVYFDPENVDSIAQAVEELLLDSGKRLKYSKRAFAYASAYSWSRCAKETFAFLKHILTVKKTAYDC